MNIPETKQVLRVEGEVRVITKEGEVGSNGIVSFYNDADEMAGQMRVLESTPRIMLLDTYRLSSFAVRANEYEGIENVGGENGDYSFYVQPGRCQMKALTVQLGRVRYPGDTGTTNQQGNVIIQANRFGTAAAPSTTTFHSLFTQNTFRGENMLIGIGETGTGGIGYLGLYATTGFSSDTTRRLFLGLRTGTTYNKAIEMDPSGNVSIPVRLDVDTISATNYLNLPVTPPPNLAPLTLDQTNNRVGINNTVPNTALDVTGNAHFTGTLDAENLAARNSLLVAGDSTFMGNLDVKGGVGIEGGLSVIGNAVLFNADVLNSVSAYKFFSGNSFLVGGAGNPNGVVDGAPGSIFMSDSGTLYVKSGTGNTGWTALGSGTTPSDLLPITLDKPNNRVGINNATPAYTLGVGGDANLSTGGTYRINTFPAVAARGSDTTIALGRTNTVPDTSTNAVAIGYAANAGPSSVSVGNNAGASTQGTGSVAIGINAARYTQANGGVAIGSGAGQGTATAGTGQAANAVAIGLSAGSSTQGSNSVAIGTYAARYNQGASSVAIGYQAAGVSAQGTNSVAIGIYSGESAQGNYAVAIGPQAGRTSQHANSIVLNATSSILNSSAANTFCVKPIRTNTASTNLLGYDATTGEITAGATASVAPSSLLPITLDKANNRVGINKVNPSSTLEVVGNISGGWEANGTSTAIGYLAGWGGGTDVKQAADAIAIGLYAGANGQKTNAVALGRWAGRANQGAYSVAVGVDAGGTSQADEAIAIGFAAGQTSQGVQAVAIGEYAGQTNQGAQSVAIGYYAANNTQAANSIVINATGASLNNSTPSSFKVKPIRQDTTATNLLGYNTSSGEITYGAVAGTAPVFAFVAGPASLAVPAQTFTKILQTQTLSAGTYVFTFQIRFLTTTAGEIHMYSFADYGLAGQKSVFEKKKVLGSLHYIDNITAVFTSTASFTIDMIINSSVTGTSDGGSLYSQTHMRYIKLA